MEKYVTDHTYEQYLNQRGIPTELRDEFKNTVTAYYKFINNNAKHHDRTEVNILEYLMYQTGNIIRLLITLKQEESKMPIKYVPFIPGACGGTGCTGKL